MASRNPAPADSPIDGKLFSRNDARVVSMDGAS
jgi:hypothetical protein